MAKQVIEVLHSDLSGEQITQDSNGGTVTFTVSGSSYEIDLTEAELAAFNEVLAPYVGAGRKVTRRGSAVSRSTIAASGTGRRSKEQLTSIRDWARKNGHTVSDRGRIPSSILDAYDAAH